MANLRRVLPVMYYHPLPWVTHSLTCLQVDAHASGSCQESDDEATVSALGLGAHSCAVCDKPADTMCDGGWLGSDGEWVGCVHYIHPACRGVYSLAEGDSEPIYCADCEARDELFTACAADARARGEAVRVADWPETELSRHLQHSVRPPPSAQLLSNTAAALVPW